MIIQILLLFFCNFFFVSYSKWIESLTEKEKNPHFKKLFCFSIKPKIFSCKKKKKENPLFNEFFLLIKSTVQISGRNIPVQSLTTHIITSKQYLKKTLINNVPTSN